jgi:glutamate-1-semialdehyde 2,1-aminomutase
MAGYDPRGGSRIVHSGTFNANPVTAAAGLAALEAYDEAAVEHVNDLGASLATRARAVIDDHQLPIRINQEGSLFNLYLTDEPVETRRDATRSDSELQHRIYMEMLDEGVRIVPKLMGCLSTPMTESDIDTFVDAFDHALERTAPEIEARMAGHD